MVCCRVVQVDVTILCPLSDMVIALVSGIVPGDAIRFLAASEKIFQMSGDFFPFSSIFAVIGPYPSTVSVCYYKDVFVVAEFSHICHNHLHWSGWVPWWDFDVL